MKAVRSEVTHRFAAALLTLSLVLAACGTSTDLPVRSGSPTPAAPRPLSVLAVDRSSGGPVPGAAVTVDGSTATADASGRARVTAAPGARVQATATGFDAAMGSVPAGGDLTIRLRPNVVHGVVTDDKGVPLSGARVFVDGQIAVARSDAGGRYALAGVPAGGTLIYKMPGFRLAALPIDDRMRKDVAMRPFSARALYAPAAVFEAPDRLDHLLDLAARTEVNALVIDVKETAGTLYWATDLPQAKKVGAVMAQPLFKLDELLPKLKARGIYTIARMVVMKDNTLGAARPDLAVMNAQTRQPWRDFGGGIWLDPFNPGVAEYVAAVAADLADKGFDEVQLDYVRFFSDGPYALADTNLPNAQSFRLPAIRRLFRVVSAQFDHRKAFLGADVFPISFISPDDQGIGQRPEVIMPYVDYFDPMTYPSHYGPGTFGFAVPNEHPYEIINQSLQRMNREGAGLPMKIRPWIQDFGYGPFRAYTRADVLAEMRALADNGARGWMIWNAQATFTESALGPPRPDEVPAPVTSLPPTPSLSAEPSPAASGSPLPSLAPSP